MVSLAYLSINNVSKEKSSLAISKGSKNQPASTFIANYIAVC